MNFWLALVVKVVAILAVMLPAALVIIFGELKISAHIQSRIGPYFAGGRWGWAQPLADGLKFLQKEDLVPAAADATVYKLAPYVVLMGTLATFVIIPFGPDLVPENLDLGIFYLLAVSSLSTLGVLMAGWASGNKYSLIGGLRAAAQLIAYELPLVLAAVAVAVQAGTMSLSGIVEAQATGEIFGLNIHLPYVLTGQVIGFCDLPGSQPRRAEPNSVRHADRRVGAHDGLPHRVLRDPFHDVLPRRVRRHGVAWLPLPQPSTSAGIGYPACPVMCSTSSAR